MAGATSEATQMFLQRTGLPSHATCRLGKTGLHVSRLGFGGYRLDAVTVAHDEALQQALRRGINLIDTSTNYGDGESEILIGRVLQALIGRREISRAAAVIVSKIGYVQGQNLRLAHERETAGRPFPEMIKYMDGCWHCIHPEFLQDQLERSLSRLQLDRLDVLLLHNPEYFLSHMKQQRVPLAQARAEYYRRLAGAFRFLEEQAAAGKIGWYGISSNTFPQASAHEEFTSLTRVWEIAQKISPQPHFAVIQFPANLFEAGAVFEKNQNEGRQTLLEFARSHDLGTLANRPLNAMAGQGMTRLADFETMPEGKKEFQKQILELAAVEQDFHLRLAPQLELERKMPDHARLFHWAGQLQEGLHSFQDWAHWDHVKQYALEPQTERTLHLLRNLADKAGAWVQWENRFRQTLTTVINTLSAVYAAGVAEKSRQLSAQLEQALPALAESRTLSQKALRVLLNTPGLDGVLLGMRRIHYVEDGLQALLAAPFLKVESAYRLWKN